MSAGSTRILFSTLCAACLVAAAGCRSRGSKDYTAGDPGVDIFDPAAIGDGGGLALGPRTADGIRVTDVSFDAVYFDYNSFQLLDGELRKIEAVADYLRRNPNVRLITEGHCDERGSNEYNLSLGEYRALAVRAHMVGLGVDGSRIQTRSYGEEQPVDPGHDEAAWKKNRRVEFALFR